MAGTTKIGWTDSTPNVLTHRCKPVLPECFFCYAQSMTNRWEGPGAFTSEPPALIPFRLLLPWLDPGVRRGQRAFLSSMSDPGHPGIPLDDLARIFAMVAADQTNDWQILTKRPHVLEKRLSDPDFPTRILDHIPGLIDALSATPSGRLSKVRRDAIDRIIAAIDGFTWPLPNAWIGVSAGSQASANKLVPVLCRIPAQIRFISVEPMIGPVDLTRIPQPSAQQPDLVWDVLGRRYGVPGRWQAPLGTGVDWVIFGGESGASARPMHIAWLRAAIRQAHAADVPVFFKQWGTWAPAPWRVPIDTTLTGEALATAQADAELIGATHAYSADAHLFDHKPTRPAHKPWSVERTALPHGHIGLRRYKSDPGNQLDGVRLEQFPVSRRLVQPDTDLTAVTV